MWGNGVRSGALAIGGLLWRWGGGGRGTSLVGGVSCVDIF